MSLFEKGWSSGEASLAKRMKGSSVNSNSAEFDIESLAEKITLGGWPALLGAGEQAALRFVQDFTLVAELDISRFGGKRRDPQKVMRLMQSLARNISTEASLTSLAKDTGGAVKANDETIAEYLEVLERLMVIEQLPAWRPHIRSADTLRKTPKRFFTDPSLASPVRTISASRTYAFLKWGRTRP